MSKSRSRTGMLIAVACAFALALTGCSGSSGSDDDGPIKIASIAPMTGPSAVYGETVVATFQHVVDKVNKDGGVEVTGKKRKLKLSVYNDEGKAQGAVAVSHEALDDGNSIILGPFNSGSTSAVQPSMGKSDAAWLLYSATVEGATANPNVFQTAGDQDAANKGLVDYLDAHPDLKRIAVITDQTHTALMGSHDELIKQIKGAGREIVADQAEKLGDTDFNSQVSEVISAKADLYILRANPTEAALITKQMRQLGGTMEIMWVATLTNAQQLKIMGGEDYMTNVTRSSPAYSLDTFVADGNPTAVALNKALGDKAGGYSAFAYDAMMTVIAALEKSDGVDKESLSKALAGLKADELDKTTLNQFTPQAKGLVFKDRRVSVPAITAVWQMGTGWVVVKDTK
ncbi:amino acid/amide ABC transporter substrate-binding protein (HAAT family) [Antricoccus suffuscus]|uniref:Amino acid/amide ABC transporter substrate-binding protein (HAAT family) n=1 Tax=Antricoccus suffuscus TaxID=1629062 RepID=A0A2T0ZWX3_9ACTN|nr:branched-chain amino acid ABC transporter substrate-binding protein [Antricoccus suffuscus]PRZ40865.1 amino acid/amide ABC transporter substrate-binding protein (HAAT family) [Antricoccus suffuscus]